MIQIRLNPFQFQKIYNFYANSYIRYLKRVFEGRQFIDDGTYTPIQQFTNATNVASVVSKDLSKIHIKPSKIKKWNSLGYKEFEFENWYFALSEIEQDVDGNLFVTIQDLMYEAEHFDGKFDNTLYERKINRIIRKELNEMLYNENSLLN